MDESKFIFNAKFLIEGIYREIAPTSVTSISSYVYHNIKCLCHLIEQYQEEVEDEGKDPSTMNVGNSDYSSMTIQPYDIWRDHGLNPWDADIIKRVLRTKTEAGVSPVQSRIQDYNKIKHICDTRISDINTGDTWYKNPKTPPWVEGKSEENCKRINESVSENEIDKQLKRLTSFIRDVKKSKNKRYSKYTSKGHAPKSYLMNVMKLKKLSFQEIIDTALGSDLIERHTHQNGNNEVEYFVLKPYATGGELRAQSFPVRTCLYSNCKNSFAPKAQGQKFCSAKCLRAKLLLGALNKSLQKITVI